jgi:hypothetical protein
MYPTFAVVVDAATTVLPLQAEKAARVAARAPYLARPDMFISRRSSTQTQIWILRILRPSSDSSQVTPNVEKTKITGLHAGLLQLLNGGRAFVNPRGKHAKTALRQRYMA